MTSELNVKQQSNSESQTGVKTRRSERAALMWRLDLQPVPQLHATHRLEAT